ncbi:hypothetical protein [Psychrobacter sp. JCM 18901]
MSTLYKVQINYGELEEEQMILKAQINYRDLLAASSNEDIIGDDDDPELMQGPINPVDDATEPSQE